MKDENKTKARLIAELQALRLQTNANCKGQDKEITERKRVEEENEIFHRIQKRLLTPLSLKECAKIIAEEAYKLFQYDAFSLDIVDAANNMLVGIYNEDTLPGEKTPQEMPSYSHSLDSVINKDVLVGKTKLINRREKPKLSKYFSYGHETQLSLSLMFVPLCYEKQTVGIISVQSYIPGKYEDNNLALFQSLGNHTGGALIRSQIEQTLRESEERYINIIEGLFVGIAIHVDNKIVFVNDAIKNMLGFRSEKDFLGRNVLEFVHPEDQKKVMNAVKAAFSGADLSNNDITGAIEERLIRTDGTELIAEVSAITMNYYGETALMVMINDITERKQAEELLQKSEARLRQIIDIVPHMVFAKDRDGRFIMANKAAADGSGTTPENMVGKTHQELPGAIPEQYESYLTDDREVIDNGKLKFIPEEDFTHIDGHKVIMETTKIPFTSAGIPAVLGVSIDITERKQAKEKLQESEKQLHTLIDTMPDFVCFKDGAGRWLKANDACIRIFQLEGIDYLGKKDSELAEINSKLRGTFLTCKETDAKAWKENSLIYGEETIPDSDGSVRIYDVSKAPVIYSDGERKGLVVLGHDITERKKAEEEIRIAHENTKTIFEKAPFGVVVIGRDRKIKMVNNTVLEMAGVDNADIILGKNCGKFLCPAQQDECPILDKGQKVDNSERIFRRKDGKEIPIIKTVTEINMDGEDVLLETFVDINERKQAEEALQKSEEKYRLLADNSIDVIWQTDLKLVFTYVSPSIKKIMGYTVNEWVGSRLSQHASTKEFFKMAKKALYAVKNSKKFKHLTFDAVLLHKDGTEISVEITGKLLLNKKGLPIGLQGITRDITERKQAEAERERLSTAIEQSAEIVVITDTQGNIQYVNPAFERITGYSKEEALGQNPRVLKSGEHTPDFYKELWDTISAGRVWAGKMINRRKDGSLFTEEATISPVLDTAGKIINYVAVKRDITNEEKLEQQFRQAQKMESVGRLAGGVAHDFNNMLAVIMGYSELALTKLKPTDKLYKEIEEINKAGRRSADLTTQLLAFSRKQTIVPQVMDLNDTVSNMLKMLRRLIGEDINLTWMPGANLGTINIDPTQIDQILANLCVNARDAINDTGKIIIETDNVTFDEAYCQTHSFAKPGGYIMLTISDDGCGMDDETKVNIFEPFFTTKAQGEGTGLGLATVYGVVKQNEGFINVYSEPGQGTSFKIYFPRYEGADIAEKAEKEKELPTGHGELILLVEDEAAIIEMVQSMLESIGYVVIAANTPQEALRLVQEQSAKIELLITDVVMPGMNGKELADRLQTLFPEIKVLFMSGYTTNVIVHKGVLEKGVNFITKPFSVPQLAIKLSEVLKL